jgi:hypothetical protein
MSSKEYGCVAVRELNFGGAIFDVVGFSPDADEFYIVECKRTSSPVGVGRTFGQILAYKSMILADGENFLDSFDRSLVKNGISKIRFWAHGSRFVDSGKIPVRFYVALLNAACERPEILQLMKKDLKDVGIIRIDKHNHCRNHICTFGIDDFKICEASRVEIPISMPIRNQVKALLDSTKSSPRVSSLTAKLDRKIIGIKPKRIRCIRRGKALVYRVQKNFTILYPHQNYLRVAIRESAGWKKLNTTKESQVARIIPKIRRALERTLE